MNEDKLVEFLTEHKRNPENFNNDGNYDPNPYWLAEDIVKLFAIPVVSQQRELLRAYHAYLLTHTDKPECNHTIEEFLIARNCG